MTNSRFSNIATAFCLGLLFLCPSFSTGQDFSLAADTNPAMESVAESESVEPLQIKLSVNEVRLDVVVLDRNGNPVTDLTAKDFEVFQNGNRQNILSSVYIDNRSGVTAEAKPVAARKDARNPAPLSTPSADLKREDISRTIILVVDDISMSFENGHHARMALRNFVEKQMQSGDMVAILKTSHGNSALQMFLSDKRDALTRIEAMRLETAVTPNDEGSHLFRVYDNQLSALSYSLRSLKDMPGRKILIMMTAVPALRKPGDRFMDGNKIVVGATQERLDFQELYEGRFSRLADDAMRSGVVVNFLNIGGLMAFDNRNAESGGRYQLEEEQLIKQLIAEMMKRDPTLTREEAEGMFVGVTTQAIQRKLESMFPQLFENERNMSRLNVSNPLPAKTGGVLIEDSNFFLDGIGRETESLMKGYYLISYTPPSDTFKSDDKEIFNQLKVNVRRGNVRVHTRDGFYNRLEDESSVASSANPLQDAVFSPFLHTDLNVGMAAGYVRDAQAGYLVRSWIHVDPRDVKIVETEDDGARIDLEMMCLTSDVNGVVQDSRRAELTINNVNSPENISLLRRHGIRFAMLLPVKKPGSYYVRTAVKDTESGKIGSAYQFVEIPDLDRKGLALSSIFVAARDEDLDWMRSDVTAEIAEVLSFSGFQKEETRSPALRTYAPGDSLLTLSMLYNADVEAAAGSGIEIRYVLYSDDEEFLRGEPVQIAPDKAHGPAGIPFSRNLTMDSALPPGDYVLQFTATGKSDGKRRESNASQAVSFAVLENLSPERPVAWRPSQGPMADNPSPEQLAAWHMESIGDHAVLSQIRSMAFAGTSEIEFISGEFENFDGLSAMVSEGSKMAIVMEFPDTDSPGEYFAYDGKDVTVGNIWPGRKSPLADFLYRYDKIMKNGLLGGVYSRTWPLFNIGRSGADMKVRKTGVEGTELYELEYRPEDYYDEMKICLYFDPETGRHVRSHYYISADDDFNSGPALTEKFENFMKVGDLTLPHGYALHIEGTAAATWKIEASNWIFNRTDIDPGIFQVDNE